MNTAADSHPLIDDDVDHAVVLESLRSFHAEYLRREQAMVLLAVQWARLNSGLKRTMPDGTPNTCRAAVDPEDLIWEDLAERGCPHIDNLTIPTFAVAAGISEFQARKLVRESLLLVFLLPRVWKRASQGQVDVWRARRLAEECWHLTPEAIDHVDRLMAMSTARHTQAGRDAVIAEAKQRFMPDEAQLELQIAQEQRDVKISADETAAQGVVSFWGALDLVDAIDLESAISSGAKLLKDLGSDAPLGVRRSWALGDLARVGAGGFHGLYDSQIQRNRGISSEAPRFMSDCACALGLKPPSLAKPPSEVLTYLHMTSDSFVDKGPVGPPGTVQTKDESGSKGTALSAGVGDATSAAPVVRVEGNGVVGSVPVPADVVQSWFTRPRLTGAPKIIFRPVIDLAEQQHTDAYEIPDRIKEQIRLRDGTCVFPWCNRKAIRTDCDHTIPWKPEGEGGPTCSCNLAPLCRSHHRAKTHADNHHGNQYTWWNYEPLGNSEYLWCGPKGSRLLRTNHGVFDVSEGRIDNGPLPPGNLAVERTLEDVVTLDPVLPKRVQAAQKAVELISATIPDEELSKEEEDGLEFPELNIPPREPTWFEQKLRETPEDVEDMNAGVDVRRSQHTGEGFRSQFLWAVSQFQTSVELLTTTRDRELQRDLEWLRSVGDVVTWSVFDVQIEGSIDRPE